jgi:hypothetical protein
MGEREELVRQRLANEERRKQEKAALMAQTEAAKMTQLNQEYDELIATFDAEGKLIAEQFEDADWSRAVLKTFVFTKKHWWSRKRTVEYACLKFATHLGGYSGWLRSDNWLYLGNNKGQLWRPTSLFPRYDQTYNMEPQLEKMRRLLKELKSYVKAA